MSADHLKIAICSNEENSNSNISDRFARCNVFAIYNQATHDYTFTINDAISEMSGAGTKAAKIMSQLDIDIALVPEVGPKAFIALEAFKIKAFKYTCTEQSVSDTLNDYFNNKLTLVNSPTTKGKH